MPADSAAAAESRLGTEDSGGLAVLVGPAPRVQPDRRIEPQSGDMPDNLRRVQAAIAGLDCSRLQLVRRSRNTDVELRGHVPTAELASDIVAASQRLAGGGIRMIENLMVLPTPICGVLDSVEAMGLPMSSDQWNDPLAAGTQARAEMPRHFDGNAATFQFQAPDYDAHIYVDYFDSAGIVQHLSPSDFQFRNRFPANSVFEIGGAGTMPQLVFAPPLGLDIILVIASSEPLYAGIRPFSEDARSYLAWLQGRVLAMRHEHPEVRAEWVFMLLQVEAG